LKQQGIDTGIHWQAGHKFSFFRDCRHGSLEITELISEQILSLPLHSNMDDNDINKIIKTIQSFK
jgi:dTDP-4-amino-4,6-dideoxygalactose transaminase